MTDLIRTYVFFTLFGKLHIIYLQNSRGKDQSNLGGFCALPHAAALL
jgi:hypothetical protein